MNFQQVKDAFIEIYGDQSDNQFTDNNLSFGDAFRAAWDAIDAFSGNDEYEAAEELASSSFLTYS